MSEEERLTIFKDITSSLHKVLECPICLETVKVPFKLCARGHALCTLCCLNLRKCPICEASFVLENPICLKNLLEVLPHFCSFSDNGCKEICIQGSDHPLYCGYRPIICRRRGCDALMPLNKLKNHYFLEHPLQPIYESVSFIMTWYAFDLNLAICEYAHIALFKNAFWILIINDLKEKCLKFYFQVTPIGKLKNEYFARIKLEKGCFAFVSTIKASVLISCETKICILRDNEQEISRSTNNADKTEEEVMVVSHNSLKNIITGDDQELKIEIYIFDKIM